MLGESLAAHAALLPRIGVQLQTSSFFERLSVREQIHTFALMFLVLFGGIFTDRSQSELDLIQVGDVWLIDDLPAEAKDAFQQTFDVAKSDDLAAAIAEVRKGDARASVDAGA